MRSFQRVGGPDAKAPDFLSRGAAENRRLLKAALGAGPSRRPPSGIPARDSAGAGPPGGWAATFSDEYSRLHLTRGPPGTRTNVVGLPSLPKYLWQGSGLASRRLLAGGRRTHPAPHQAVEWRSPHSNCQGLLLRPPSPRGTAGGGGTESRTTLIPELPASLGRL